MSVAMIEASTFIFLVLFCCFFLFRLQDSDDDISHLEWETVRVRLIKAGTLEKLVESLASDTGELESTYVNVFLATYRTFSTASQILALIAKRYADLNNPTVMEAVRLQHKKYANFCVSQCDMTMMMLSHVFHIFN
jgi:hypothetical protein